MSKAIKTIPVFDICSLKSSDQLRNEIIAAPFGAYLQQHPNLHAAHRHSFYHLVLFTKGSGHHTIDFEQFQVQEQQMYFMKPGQVHSWSFASETDGYIINFSEELLDDFLAQRNYLDAFPFFEGIAAQSVILLNDVTYQEVSSILHGVISNIKEAGFMATDMARALLIQLFITVSRQMPGNAPLAEKPQNQLVLHNFRKLVEKYYAEKRLPKDYAAMLYITPNHLNAVCQDFIGKSAGEVIRDRILLEARRLLVNADLSILEIAVRLSFTDNSHLSKFFKKHTGVSPEEFRKKSLQQVKIQK